MPIEIRCRDARTFTPTNYARLVFCDPPQAKGYNESAYSDACLEDIEYERFTLDWISNCIQAMLPNAYLVICTCPANRFVIEKVMHHHFSNLKFVQEIIWHYEFGLYTNLRFVSSHDNILVYKFGSPIFYWQSVAIESQRQRVHDKRADPRGRTPGTVWAIPRTPGNSKTRNYIHTGRRSCQPVELSQRFILAMTAEGEQVIDPFCGTGSVAVACQETKRNYYGIDICQEYCDEAKVRVFDRWEDELLCS